MCSPTDLSAELQRHVGASGQDIEEFRITLWSKKSLARSSVSVIEYESRDVQSDSYQL